MSSLCLLLLSSGASLRSWRAERFFPSSLLFSPSSNPCTSLLLSFHILDYIHRVSRRLETPMMRSIFRGSSLIQISLGTPANVLVISSKFAEFMLL